MFHEIFAVQSVGDVSHFMMPEACLGVPFSVLWLPKLRTLPLVCFAEEVIVDEPQRAPRKFRLVVAVGALE